MLVMLLLMLAACSTEMRAEGNRAVFERELRKAEQGDRLAASRVGGMYSLGIGTYRDSAKAVYWYEQAGPLGGWAMLGLMYEEGKDVPKDLDRAAMYYRQAAETGSATSMYQLGRLHADRAIGGADAVEGYMWLLLAERVGKARGACALVYECKEWAIKDRPGYRARLKSELTAAQRAEAEQRMAVWLSARPSIRR
jgi:hypothetical protein